MSSDSGSGKNVNILGQPLPITIVHPDACINCFLSYFSFISLFVHLHFNIKFIKTYSFTAFYSCYTGHHFIALYAHFFYKGHCGIQNVHACAETSLVSSRDCK